MSVHTHHEAPAVTDGHGQDISQGALALMLKATAEQHRAVIELQALFAKQGGDLSTHFLTAAAPRAHMQLLEDLKSFAVLNFSPSVTVQVGFGGRSASAGNGIPVPPSSFLQLPLETNIATLGAAESELATVEQAMVVFIRFRHLVGLNAGPLSSLASGASGGQLAVTAVTAKSPRAVAVGLASEPVIAANGERKGLSIENTGTARVSLGLGAAAIANSDVVLEPAGSWDGTISGVLWRGAVNAIGAAASSLAVVEV